MFEVFSSEQNLKKNDYQYVFDHQIKKLKNEPTVIADFNLVLSQHELLISNSILVMLTNFQSMFDKNEYLKYFSIQVHEC